MGNSSVEKKSDGKEEVEHIHTHASPQDHEITSKIHIEHRRRTNTDPFVVVLDPRSKEDKNDIKGSDGKEDEGAMKESDANTALVAEIDEQENKSAIQEESNEKEDKGDKKHYDPVEASDAGAGKQLVIDVNVDYSKGTQPVTTMENIEDTGHAEISGKIDSCVNVESVVDTQNENSASSSSKNDDESVNSDDTLSTSSGMTYGEDGGNDLNASNVDAGAPHELEYKKASTFSPSSSASGFRQSLVSHVSSMPLPKIKKEFLPLKQTPPGKGSPKS